MMHDPIATLSPGTLTMLTALLEARTGQQLASYRSWRIDTALKPLVRERGLDTLDQLVDQLVEGADAGIADQIVDALVNGETSFFRDAAMFDQLADVLGELSRSGRRPRVWCAGCSTGQEPLSLAMLAAELDMPIDIVATDVSGTAVLRARSGRYTQFEVQRGLPIRRLVQWLDGGDEGEWVAKAELVRAVSWRRHNLVADAPPGGGFDVILCRNVLLYLAPPTKQAVFASLSRALRPGALLVLGAGETVIGQTDALTPSRRWRGFYERAA